MYFCTPCNTWERFTAGFGVEVGRLRGRANKPGVGVGDGRAQGIPEKYRWDDFALGALPETPKRIKTSLTVRASWIRYPLFMGSSETVQK